MTIAKELMDRLKASTADAEAAGGASRLEKRKAKDLMSARERITFLFDAGTFQEFGKFAQHDCHDFGMDQKSLPGDGVITGTGLVSGRPVAAFSQDFTVGGGALGRIHAKKIVDLMDYAEHAGIPVVGINDSGGARIQEGVNSLSGYGQVFFKNVEASGVIPQVAIIAGPCAGGAAYSPALMDFLIMTRDNANMFICGPNVIESATGERATLDQFASAAAHATVSGNIHFVAEDERHALQIATKLLSYLPSNNVSDPPHSLTDELSLEPIPEFREVIPEDSKLPMDTQQVIQLLVDPGSFFEIQRDYAKNMIIGFARIEGVVVGIVANQSMVKAGCLDINSSDKSSRFIRECNIYNIPIVSLVDVPGFMPGLAQERGGIIRHGAKMLFAFAAASVPKITVIMRKAYGGAYLAMCSKDMGADIVFAWPTAEIAVMGAGGATKILYRNEIKEAEDPNAKEVELTKAYREKFLSPYQAAAHAMITDVIDPADTRAKVALALRNTLSKRVLRPAKKHGNIPL
jgi:propionyl-CoA carboxylase beta chain